jgi:putative PIN family toxin of toxin-antitoxin system
MLDTNVLLSALIFRSAKLAVLLEHVVNHHTLVLSAYIIEEAERVITLKSPKYSGVLYTFLNRISFELVPTIDWNDSMPDIRDSKDKPILAAAISAQIDYLITGDKDFEDLRLNQPKIITPNEYFESFI